MNLASDDKFFKKAIHLYTTDVPYNTKESFYRAKFTDRGVLNMGWEALVGL